MGRQRFADRSSARFLCRVLLLLVVTYLPTAFAQQHAQVSPSVVLVLKLVSNTLVKPTTGIVVSNDGLVMVPAGFAAEAGEMIVLDGGTDIASNGRPAKLVDGEVAGELALLSVKGLKRPGISLSGNLADTGGSLHLEAFPPAEEIARGAEPLSLPAKILLDSRTGQYAISAETPLPYVTGAILDECGQLAGVSLVDGPQSLDTGKAATVLLGADLGRLLDAMQIKLPASTCARMDEAAVALPAAAGTQSETAGTERPIEPAAPDNQDDTAETGIAKPSEVTPPEPALPETASAKAERETVTRAAEPPAIWQLVPAWLLALAIIGTGVLAWKIIYFLRLKPHAHENPGRPESTASLQPASDEPDTAPLADTGNGTALKPRSAPVMDFDIPETASRPAGCNGLLLVEGMLDADTPFKRFCFVTTGQIDIVIGRGDADIAIEHPAVSRSHARIRSAGEHLTYSDLGSRNGSFIGDVPCLAGEVMYLDAGSEVFLGDVKITIDVVNQEAEWA